ncbi:hypothetical protein [Ruficoccus sp. ZRK36]|uniref:hypothetical protein n=1 Tax=Ruficoccus sp. ZRK36 TaxID=2866311 RepID=UPI001C733ACA|nr:hypothetical protein [Ruficoccus sp. ZRK36]QYY36410.1 hypothetical protein K0V07_02820 [Ruficoccus sp. ZRK36]
MKRSFLILSILFFSVLPCRAAENGIRITVDYLTGELPADIIGKLTPPPEEQGVPRALLQGAIEKPGVYSCQPSESLTAIVSRAGGLTRLFRNPIIIANIHSDKLIRIENINTSKPDESWAALSRILVKNGDFIYLEETIE